MSLDVTLAVNGRAIGRIHIVNRGAPDHAPHEANDPDGLRRYEWSTGIGRNRGETLHRRSDGAVQLVAAVLADLAAMQTPGEGN